MDFEEWFESQDDIGCLIGLEGYAAEQAWNARQAEIDKLKMSNHYLSVQVLDAEAYAEYCRKRSNESQAEIRKAVLSLRNEFDLWADDTEQFHAIEAQIEQLEELLK